MAMPASFKTAYDRQAGYFRDRYVTASRFQTSDAIHDTRVSLKRLRAFFNLVEAVNPFFRADRSFAPARRLFRAAGKLRNIQVLLARARQAAKDEGLELSEYYNWLKTNELEERTSFGRACEKFGDGFFASAWGSIASSVEGLTEGEITVSAEGKLAGILQDLREERDPAEGIERLHMLRIRSKEARYTLEIFQEGRPPDDDRVALDGLLKSVHQSLGRWRDDVVEIESLQRFQETRDSGALFSPRSYISMFRSTEKRTAEHLAQFEAAWKALSELLHRDTQPVSPRG